MDAEKRDLPTLLFEVLFYLTTIYISKGNAVEYLEKTFVLACLLQIVSNCQDMEPI
jgi:hypothetical protein